MQPALLAVPVAALMAGCASAPAATQAACAAPQTKVAPALTAPGQAVTVSAPGMWDGCNDQGLHENFPPLKNQAVTMTSRGKALVLGRVSADPDTGLARIRVTIPAASKAGIVVLRFGTAEPVELTLTAK